MDEKLAGILALGKNVVVTGWNGILPLSMGDLVTIPTDDIVTTTVTSEIGDGFLGTEIDDKLAVTLALGKTDAFIETIGTEAIGDGRSVPFFFLNY